MKRICKQVLSVAFSILVLVTSLLPVFAEGRTDLKVPVVLIHGMGDDILNKKGKNVYTLGQPKGGVSVALKTSAPLLLKALVTERKEAWDACRKKLLPLIKTCFGPFFLDKNGEPSNGTHCFWDWDHGNLPNLKTETGFGWDGYDFWYDWRLDPFTLAKTLHAYIADIKKATGCKKVDIIARSAGNLPLIAYLEKYGNADLRCVVFKVSPLKGMDLLSALFSGKIRFDAASILRYKRFGEELQFEDELLNEAVELLLGLAYDVMALDLAAWSLNYICRRLYTELLVPLLRQTYATFPSVWAMVSEEDFDTARKNIFEGHEKEYAGLLKKIDRYDKRVRRRLDDIILDAQEHGLKVAVLAKYGNFQEPPVGKHSSDICDNMIALSETSFGATVAKYGDTLPVTRYFWTMLSGKKEYISADKMVDASTCLLPDTTWFIYGSGHAQAWSVIEDYICNFFAADGKLTVFDRPDMPQFVLDNGQGALVPITPENAPKLETPKHAPNRGSGKWKLPRLIGVLVKLLMRKNEK